VDGPNESTHFNFPPPDLTNTPENSTHIYFKDIILPASDEVRAPVSCWPQAASRASAEGHGHAQQRGAPPGRRAPPSHLARHRVPGPLCARSPGWSQDAQQSWAPIT
jgi:hypothetical protein